MEPALVFRQAAQLVVGAGGDEAGLWACSSSARTTRAVCCQSIGPAKMAGLCAPLTPMQFNDLYCLARPEVHTLSCGAARPSDFDEHVAALEFYGREAETIAPMEKRLRAEMEKVLGVDWCKHWSEGLPEFSEAPDKVNIIEILRLWTYARITRLICWSGGECAYHYAQRERRSLVCS